MRPKKVINNQTPPKYPLKADKTTKSGSGKRYGSTYQKNRGEVFDRDPFIMAKEIYGAEIENNLKQFDTILDKLKGGKSPNKTVEQVYKQLVSKWKEQQRKLGKNTSPGEGTRSRLMKLAKQKIENPSF